MRKPAFSICENKLAKDKFSHDVAHNLSVPVSWNVHAAKMSSLIILHCLQMCRLICLCLLGGVVVQKI